SSQATVPSLPTSWLSTSAQPPSSSSRRRSPTPSPSFGTAQWESSKCRLSPRVRTPSPRPLPRIRTQPASSAEETRSPPSSSPAWPARSPTYPPAAERALSSLKARHSRESLRLLTSSEFSDKSNKTRNLRTPYAQTSHRCQLEDVQDTCRIH